MHYLNNVSTVQLNNNGSPMFSGRDIGVNLPILLNAIVAQLPPDASTMLRIGMTNPPFILEHLKEIAEVLRHPCVYSFLHVPVQSGSDAVLTVCPKFFFIFLSSYIDTISYS